MLPNDLVSPNTDGNINDDSQKTPHNNSQFSIKYQKRNANVDQRYLSSIDYTWEDVRYMIVECGFEILEEETNIPAQYASDAESMMKVVYQCAFVVARKKALK